MVFLFFGFLISLVLFWRLRFSFLKLAHLSHMCKRLIWATGTSFCRTETFDTALEPPGSILLSHEQPQVCAHIRHTTLKKYDFLMIFVIYVGCAWCVQILLMFSQHLKLLRVDLKLSNEYRRSFVAQKLIPVAQMEIWCKFWKIDFRMKNLISDRKSDFSIRSWVEPQERVFVVGRRATRRWKALGPYFRVLTTHNYVHTSGTS